MSAEFLVNFKDFSWYTENRSNLLNRLSELKTYVPKDIVDNNFWILGVNEFWLKGSEKCEDKNRWNYDVRLFFHEDKILLEISMHPKSIEKDLSIYFSWLRSQTNISVDDEDGEASEW